MFAVFTGAVEFVFVRFWPGFMLGWLLPLGGHGFLFGSFFLFRMNMGYFESGPAAAFDPDALRVMTPGSSFLAHGKGELLHNFHFSNDLNRAAFDLFSGAAAFDCQIVSEKGAGKYQSPYYYQQPNGWIRYVPGCPVIF